MEVEYHTYSDDCFSCLFHKIELRLQTSFNILFWVNGYKNGCILAAKIN